MKKRNFTAILLLSLLLAALLALAACEKDKGYIDDPDDIDTELDMSKSVQAVIVMENGDEITLELYPDIAPITVKNFVKLARDGYYNGKKFHRVENNVLIQAGALNDDGTGGSGTYIYGEFNDNGFKNDIGNDSGTVYMARSSDYNSASAQFFILVNSGNSYENRYAGFGKVVSGMQYVRIYAETEVDSESHPVEPLIIKEIKILPQ